MDSSFGRPTSSRCSTCSTASNPKLESKDCKILTPTGKRKSILRMKSSQRSWPTAHCSHQTGFLDIDAGDFEISRKNWWILESLPSCSACVKLIKSKPCLGTWATEDFDFDMTHLHQERRKNDSRISSFKNFVVQKRPIKNDGQKPAGPVGLSASNLTSDLMMDVGWLEFHPSQCLDFFGLPILSKMIFPSYQHVPVT